MGPKDIVQIILQSGALGLLALILYFCARYVFPALKDFLTQLVTEQRRTNETLAEMKATITADREIGEQRSDRIVAEVREAIRTSTEECRNSDRGERRSFTGGPNSDRGERPERTVPLGPKPRTSAVPG